MDYRALIASALLDIDIDVHLVQQIEAGAMIYGDAGFLDSVHLVALIAAIEERLAGDPGAPVSLFARRDVDLVDEFADVETLASFLEHCVHDAAAVK
jgi:hypothetical protein